ncbi:Lengsin [Heterocephalus glaber]|uniref:Lengsin n=1 Tax=Heterocephalus glaber TaxID=10181 RepID=G5BZQ7_HETGA|nr:Lengsin [Heterocephalus glaber]
MSFVGLGFAVFVPSGTCDATVVSGTPQVLDVQWYRILNREKEYEEQEEMREDEVLKKRRRRNMAVSERKDSCEERTRNQMLCHKLGDSSKPAESHLSHDDKDAQDWTTATKTSPPKIATHALVDEFNPNSDRARNSTQILTPPQLSSKMKHIKQEMTKNHLQFVRFEATDLHDLAEPGRMGFENMQQLERGKQWLQAQGSGTVTAVCINAPGSMADDEVNHIRATCFNSDVVLRPELCTFRVLPWVPRTARVICDTFTVTGEPLPTSPRCIAKRQLSQLQDAGFSLLSAFLCDFCVFGVSEVINSKAVSFPVPAFLDNHDQPFMQELVNGLCHTGATVESFSSSTRPGQMEICFLPEFGIASADNAFTLRTAVKEVARKYNYIASFFLETGFCNSGILSHSVWHVSGKKNVFCSSPGAELLTPAGQKWLAGLLKHSPALSCLLAPDVSCRKCYCKDSKDPKTTVPVAWGYNDNSCAFNIKSHGGRGTRIENKLGSATANPYLVLAATIAAGLDGLQSCDSAVAGEGDSTGLCQAQQATIPVKLEDALMALEEDQCLRQALGETFIRYFVAMKKYELENEETDAERNKFLEYFI